MNIAYLLEFIKKPLVVHKPIRKGLILLALWYGWGYFDRWIDYKIVKVYLFLQEQDKESGMVTPGDGEPGKSQEKSS